MYKDRGIIFEVIYWPPNERFDYSRLYIRSGSVLLCDIKKARDGLNKEVYPMFLKWIKSIDISPNSPYLNNNPRLIAYYKDEKIIISSEI